MSDDIRCFNASELNPKSGLPAGWYVGTERSGLIVEATGPYPDQMTAAIKMTSAGGAVWLHGDGTVGNWTWCYPLALFVSKAEQNAKPATHEYAFDVKLTAAIRVVAASEADARAMLAEHLQSASCNGGAWPNGDPILFEASHNAGDDYCDLYEVDGVEVDQ